MSVFYMKTQICNKCKTKKSINKFYRLSGSKNEYIKICKVCCKNRDHILSKEKKNDFLFKNVKYIYIITHPLYSEWIKIGQTVNPEMRLKSYQTHDPTRSYEIYFKIKTNAVWYIERYFREYIKSNGYEWFKISMQRAKKIILKLIKEDIESKQLRLFD